MDDKLRDPVCGMEVTYENAQARSEYNGEAVWVGGKSWDEAKYNLIARLNRLASATPTPEPETIEI